MSDLISRQAALDAIHCNITVTGRQNAELVAAAIGVFADRIKALPPVQPEILASGEGELNVPDMNVGDMIYRQAAMESLMAQNVIMDGSEYHNGFNAGVNRAQEVIRNLSPVQQEITHEQAIDYLHETGWLQNHDRILTESKIVPPPRGEWIDTETSYADGVRQECRCSVCARLSPRPLGDFCRWCGADMRGKQDEQA